MNSKNKTWIILKVGLCITLWYALTRAGAYGAARIGEGWPQPVIMFLTSMLIPYGILFPAAAVFLRKMKTTKVEEKHALSPAALIKLAVIQSGFSILILFVINLILTAIGLEPSGTLTSQISQNLAWYLALLLIFNPVVEEIFFRRLVLDSLRILGNRDAVNPGKSVRNDK